MSEYLFGAGVGCKLATIRSISSRSDPASSHLGLKELNVLLCFDLAASSGVSGQGGDRSVLFHNELLKTVAT